MESRILQPDTLFYRVFHDSPVGMVVTTLAEGRYVEVNRSYARLLGYSPDELIGQSFPVLGLVHEEERNLVVEVLRQTGKLADIPLLLRTREGAILTAIGSVQMEEFDGQNYLVSMIQDLTDHTRVQSALQSVENRSRIFFQSIPLPLIVFDATRQRILDVNPAACRGYGYSHDEFTKLTLDDIRPAEAQPAPAAPPAEGAPQPMTTERHRRRDGSLIEVDVTSYAFELDGRPARLSIIQDVTEQRAVERALRAGGERLRILADVSTDAIWDRDMATEKVEWSPGLHTLFGFEPDGEYAHDWWLEQVHPDEREALNDGINAAFASAENRWLGEYRFRRADGNYANVLDRGYIVRDENGRPTRFVGAMMDITSQLQVAEVAARATQEERQRLARDLHEAVTQSLYSASLMAEAARRHSSDSALSITGDYVERLSDLSKQALRQLRLLVYELRPALLEQEGLVGALRHRLEAVEQRAGIRARLDDELATPVPGPLQSELFAIAQEALNHSLRHAAATATTVRLVSSAEDVSLEVRGDGDGADSVQSLDGAGLQALRERVERLGGRLDIERQPGGGVVVRARLPLGYGAGPP